MKPDKPISTLRFSALAGIYLEPVARRAQDPDDTVEDTTWTSVRLIVLENHGCNRCGLFRRLFYQVKLTLRYATRCTVSLRATRTEL